MSATSHPDLNPHGAPRRTHRLKLWRPNSGGRQRPFWALGASGLALAATLILLVGTPTASAAATLQVNAATGLDSPTCGTATPCKTIGQAITNASAGDTIQVAAGTYNEQVTIDKALTLEGTDRNTTTISWNSATAVTITAANVTFEGFTVKGSSVYGIYPQTSDVTIQDNIVENNSTGIYWNLGGKAGTNLQILNNILQDNGSDTSGGAGAELTCGATPTEINGNTGWVISGNTAKDDYGAGIDVECTTGAQVTDNQVSGTKQQTSGPWAGQEANLNVIFSKDATVSGNTVSNGYRIGISLWNTQSSTVKGNSVSGITGSGVGVFTGSDGTNGLNGDNNTIIGNTLTGNLRGIDQWASDPNLVTGTLVHFNDLTGDTTDGIENDVPTSVIDATDNWWGSANGPTVSANTYNAGSQGVGVTTGVTFAPWLTSAPALGATSGADFAPVTDTTSGAKFASIQAAVDAATAADTIQVAAGTYTENVSIGKSLTLKGANAGVAGTSTRVAESIVDGHSVSSAFLIGASNVTIDGFTIKGGQHGEEAGVKMAPTDQHVTIENNIITDNEIGVYARCGGDCVVERNEFIANNLSGPAGGAGIYTDQSNGLMIESNDFTGQTINSVIIFDVGIAPAHQNDTVSNNTIHDNNSNNSMVYVVSMTGGTFSGNTITQSGAAALTFAGADTNISVTGNHLTGSAKGVKVTDDGFGLGPSSNIAVHQNDLSNDTAGVAVSSGYSGTLDAGSNWWGLASGPGAVAGVTTAPWCTDSSCSTLSNDADLTALSVSAGTLSPAFSASTTSYTARVGNGTSSFTVGATATPGATVVGAGGYSLKVGDNSVTVKVTSADGSASKSYAVTVVRTAAPATTTTATATATTTTPAPPPPTTTTTTTTPTPTPPNKPQTVAATPDRAGSAEVTVAPVSIASVPSSGKPSPAAPVSVKVDWAPGTFTTPVSVTVTPKPELAAPAKGSTVPPPVAGGFSVGSTVVQVNVTSEAGTSKGQAVTQFQQPLKIHLSSFSAGDVPAYSEDGKSWTTIPRIYSLPLPAGQADGYFVNPDGSVDIYTRHATLYGYLLDTQAPSKVTLHARITSKHLRLALLGARDNVRVVGYVVWRNGHGWRAVNHNYLALPLRVGRYRVVALDAAHNISRPSNTIRVVRTHNKKHPFAIRPRPRKG